MKRKCLLKEGALIVVDNTLWKGLVLAETEEWKDNAPDASLFSNNVPRMQRMAKDMHLFNDYVTKEAHRLHPLLLPFRDGLTVIVYRPTPASSS
jgi:predicted O-methyltransferase YrrM